MKTLLALLLLIPSLSWGGSDKTSWLLVHTSSTAYYEDNQMINIPLSKDIFAFSDRPNRKYLYLNAKEFISLWDINKEGSFHSDPPNAVIAWTYNKQIQEAEIIIDNVVSTENGVRYLFRIITGQIPKGELSNVSIFIDNLSSSNLTSGFIDLA